MFQAQSHAKEIEEQLATAQAAVATAEETTENLRAEFGKEKEALNARIAEMEANAEAHTAEMQQLNENLKGAKEALATAEQTIADKDAQIAELSNDPGNEPEQGAAPQNNGEGAHAPSLREFDPSQYKTCAERKAAFEKFKRGE